MSDFGEWLRQKITRLDGVRERRIIAIGAMVLFLVLLAGPKTLQAFGTIARLAALIHQSRPSPPAAASLHANSTSSRLADSNAPAPLICSTDTWSCAGWDACSKLGSQSRVCDLKEDCPGVTTPAPVTTQSCTPPLPPPVLSILLPLPDASQAAPLGIAAIIKDSAAVGVMFEVRDGSGALTSLQASPSTASGVWSALFEGTPGLYSLSVRASFVDGSVKDFPDRQSFRILESIKAPAPAASDAAGYPTESSPPVSPPTVELLAPLEQTSQLDGSTPMYARVTDGAPDQLVFVVDSDAGGETIVLGAKSLNGDYWTGFFEGADGGYSVRVRAHVAETDYFSDSRHFTFKR